jgi:hypothetical protein
MRGVICCKGDATVRLSPRGIRSRRSNAARGADASGAQNDPNADVHWLSAVKVNADGSLDRLNALPSHIGPAEFLEGTVVVLAELLGLLVALIGLDLTTRLIGEIWPKLGSTISLASEGQRGAK